MAKLHRLDRYNRVSDDVAKVTGKPAQTVAEYVVSRPELFS
jgi:hypothetical protein